MCHSLNASEYRYKDERFFYSLLLKRVGQPFYALRTVLALIKEIINATAPQPQCNVLK